MVAISSFKPFGQDADYDANTVKAKHTWDLVFNDVFYLNEIEPELETERTWFVGNNDYPTIKQMCEFAGAQNEWTCLINADIVVTDMLKTAVSKAQAYQAWALVSYRWQEKNGRVAVTDNGLDFFAAVPALWRKAAQEVPEKLRIGHQTWDTWMIGFFNRYARNHFYNITDYRCILHPIHGGRVFKYDVSGALNGSKGFYGMPRKL